VIFVRFDDDASSQSVVRHDHAVSHLLAFTILAATRARTRYRSGTAVPVSLLALPCRGV
jgi:hypothetical protein